MIMLRTLLALALIFLPLSEASAGSGTITTKDAAGTTRTFVVTTDGSGNFVGQSVICDGTAAANCAAVDASGRVSVLLPAETTKVIGTVNQGTSPWVISGTVTANLGTIGAAATAANQGLITTWAGGTLGAMANYGTSPGAVLVPGVNAFVTNSNANGSATSANSSPVVIASDQAAVAVKAASGTIASGALASGAVVDITNISVAPGTAPPSKVVALGANASGATGGFMAGLVQCDSKAIYDASTNGSTELVALTSGRTIYVCGYSIVSGGTVNVKLIYGTGTACATGSNNMTPAFQLTAQVGLVDGSPFYRGLKTASANALCINTSAGVAAQAIVYYSVI